MSESDEPLLGRRSPSAAAGDAEDAETRLAERIRRLTSEQPYAVLATQGEGQPYGSVVAFAFSDDLRHVAFATPTATRKYRLLSACDRVALVIDDRPDHRGDMMRVEAVTATGRAVRIEPGDDFDEWAARLTARHPQLASFVASPTAALFRIDIVRFLHVARFQEVREWIPPAGS